MTSSEIDHKNLDTSIKPLEPNRIHFVLLFKDGQHATFDFQYKNHITEAFDRLGRRHGPALVSEQFNTLVVIDQFESVQIYQAAVAQWLCGVGPDPAKRDPNWMG